MRTLKLLTIISLLTTLMGCATVFQPGPDKIQVNSTPEGAKVYLNEEPVGVTPLVVSVNRKNDCVIKIQKEGYDSVIVFRNKVVSGWVFADILLWPTIIVDLATSNQGHYAEDPVYKELNKTMEKQALK